MNDKSGFQIEEQAPRFYESNVSLFMAPFVGALVDAAVLKDAAVLDVACGTGIAARAAAVGVGPGGRVVGSDINAGMVAMARSVPHNGGCEISWQQASASDLPYSNGEFDAVICQQGIQFFPDVCAGLREMTRVIGEGGCLAATVWAQRQRSPYLDAMFAMLSEYCGGDQGANAAWQVERGEEQVRGWFEAADLGDVNIELVEAIVPMPPIAAYVRDHLQALPPVSLGNFFSLGDDAQDELLRALDGRLGDYRSDSGFDMPFRSYLATTMV